MRALTRWQAMVKLFMLATVVYAIATRQSHGTFLRVPFEFRRPTVKRFRDRWWNSGDGRLFTPHVFGVGWSLNAHQAAKRLGLLGPASQEGVGEQPTGVADQT